MRAAEAEWSASTLHTMKAFSQLLRHSRLHPKGPKDTMAPPLPAFLGLGTQKGGTTTLHRLLAQHPDVFLPPCKELHYFDQHYEAGESWYRQQFTGAKPNQHCGDITPFYLFHPDVPARIHKLLPNAQMIVLLRDPVERAISQVFHAKRLGFEDLPPKEAFAAEASRLANGDPYSLQKHSYLSRSSYLEQLDRYEALFPTKQLLILRSEDLFNDTAKVWMTLLDFLQLRHFAIPRPLPRANPGDGLGDTIDPALRNQLRTQLKETVDGIHNRYGIGWNWN